MKSIVTLNDEFDYVRAMDYSPVGNFLYSVSDSGIARVWDVNVGKIISSWKANTHEVRFLLGMITEDI